MNENRPIQKVDVFSQIQELSQSQIERERRLSIIQKIDVTTKQIPEGTR